MIIFLYNEKFVSILALCFHIVGTKPYALLVLSNTKIQPFFAMNTSRVHLLILKVFIFLAQHITD